MSAADPEIFDHKEVVLESSRTGKQYTPADYRQLLADAGLDWLRPLAEYYIGFVEFDDPAHFPYVDVYAERGSGIPTQIGAILPNFMVGQVVDPTIQLILAPGDINQEDITNLAVNVWSAMPLWGNRLCHGRSRNEPVRGQHGPCQARIDLDGRS